jgi:hypothetical protein
MRQLFTLLSISVLASFCACAQLATTTSLVGTITDTSGKTVPGAKVMATNQGTSDRYTATTNEQGYYNFPFVSIGNYELTVEQPRLPDISHNRYPGKH